MDCRKCGQKLEERTHKILTDKIVHQPFFFMRWYKCKSCGTQYNFEIDKVFNKTSYYGFIRNRKLL